ncbi:MULTISPECIES: hypothetical protein [Nostoc]|uniref:Uncharacterized protein n=1 Tax=Nostoc paludosum FACHB-159 TaxID=2692908 RepID=A0ABR8KD26_9NOSO|nr:MULTISPECIES: hypothetical protein [Nostoc]MBD2680385.1 hypothetical protein [Nostoc sp. FACHB-857]MBD2736773.1 hypothetical protein [Nostoc paludosum FACHB-159]
MDSQTLQPTVLDAQTLQKLQDDIQQEMCESLNKANFRKILEKYGISSQEVIKFQCTLDLTKLQSNQANEGQQLQNFLGLLPSKLIHLSVCTCWSEDEGKLVDCPCR